MGGQDIPGKPWNQVPIKERVSAKSIGIFGRKYFNAKFNYLRSKEMIPCHSTDFPSKKIILVNLTKKFGQINTFIF